MGTITTPLTYLIILANVVASFYAFNNLSFLEKNIFRTSNILKRRQYGRLVSSGFIHGDLTHLLFNMFTLYSFGRAVESLHGPLFFGGIYISSLLGGNLLSLLLHRNQPEYSSLGASGAINGVLFSSILVFPEIQISLFFMLTVPGWLFAVLYTVYSLYSLRSQTDNIGHDAHLGGAIVGTLVTVAFFPELALQKWMVLTTILVPGIVFLYILIAHPQVLGFEKGSLVKKIPEYDPTDHQQIIRAEKEAEKQRILEKIKSSGYESLSEYEKRFLNMNK